MKPSSKSVSDRQTERQTHRKSNYYNPLAHVCLGLKCLLRIEKLKTNGASETEEQREKRLMIRRVKDTTRRRLRKLSLGWVFVRSIMYQHSILVLSVIRDIP